MRVLGSFKASKQRMFARPAVREAAKLLRSEMKALAPKDTGTLKRSIKTKVITFKRLVGVMAIVGSENKRQSVVRDGKMMVANPAKYAHLVEFGTEHSVGKPFMRPAFDKNAHRINGIMQRRIWGEIHKHVLKMRSRK